MAWHKEGETIRARYFDQTVEGRVLDSRVKYGGQVQHSVELSQAITLPWRSEPVTRVLIDEDEIVTG